METTSDGKIGLSIDVEQRQTSPLTLVTLHFKHQEIEGFKAGASEGGGKWKVETNGHRGVGVGERSFNERIN